MSCLRWQCVECLGFYLNFNLAYEKEQFVYNNSDMFIIIHTIFCLFVEKYMKES